MRACEVMKKEVIFVKPSTSVVEARKIMRDFGIRHLPVVDQGELVGIISDSDILLSSTLREGRIDVPDHPVARIMSTNVLTCFPSSSLADIAATMVTQQISCVPVVIDRRLLGIVTTSDFLRLASSREGNSTQRTGSGIDLDALRTA